MRTQGRLRPASEHYQQVWHDHAPEGQYRHSSCVPYCRDSSSHDTDDFFLSVILAKGFDILLGRIEVSVPWVIEDSDYSVVRELSSVLNMCRLMLTTH